MLTFFIYVFQIIIMMLWWFFGIRMASGRLTERISAGYNADEHEKEMVKTERRWFMAIRSHFRGYGYRYGVFVCGAVLILLWQMTCHADVSGTGSNYQVSGRLVDGYRVLDAGGIDGPPEFTVFRGDYIKFDLGPAGTAVLSIPALNIETSLSPDLDNSPYVKMTRLGVFDFFIGDTSGTIRVVAYTESHYKTVSAREAADIIGALNPLVLDVRTPREYAAGHLAGAVLIPVQELQRRHGEILAHRDAPVLIYCATGNRSTVASKILIDRGFTRIFNMKKGIREWGQNRLPIVK